MKNATTKMMLAAVVLTAASTVASAQSIKAEIPFPFQAAGKTMPAGVYRVYGYQAESRFELLSLTGTSRTVLLSKVSDNAPKEWNKAKGGVLQFVCGERGCALAQIWTNTGNPAHRVSMPSPADHIGARAAAIRVIYGTAD